jgi:hypothetical protein
MATAAYIWIKRNQFAVEADPASIAATVDEEAVHPPRQYRFWLRFVLKNLHRFPMMCMEPV